MSYEQLPSFSRPSTWRGEWWNPDTPGEKFPGELRYTPEGGLQLQIYDPDGDINDGARRRLRDLTRKPVIHGYANGTPATLVATELSHSQYAHSSSGRTHLDYEYRATGLVYGLHMLDPDEPLIESSDFGIEQAAYWPGNRPPWQAFEGTEPFHGGGDSFTAQFGEHTLELSSWLKSGSQGDSVLGLHSENLITRNFILHGPLVSYNDLMEKQHLIILLLSLATGESPKLIHSRAFFTRGENQNKDDTPWLPSAQIIPDLPLCVPNNENQYLAYEWSFTLEDVEFAEIIPKWVDLNKLLGGAVRIILGNRYLKRPVLESLLISTVAAAEAIHQKLEPGGPEDQETFSQAKERILEGTPEAYKERMRNVFTNRHSLKQRLVGLMERLPPELRRFNWLTRDCWIPVARDARNNISHSGSTTIPARDLYDAYQELEQLLLINLMLELGVPMERIDEWVLRDLNRRIWPRWSHRRKNPGRGAESNT